MKKMIVSLFLTALVLTGCGVGGNPIVNNVSTSNPVSEGLAKEIGKGLAGKMMGGANIDFTEEGSSYVVAWPKEIPSDVPVFKYGKIDAAMSSPDGSEGAVAIQFSEVQSDAYDKYIQDLEDAGFTITTDPRVVDQSITAEKDGKTIQIDKNAVDENTALFYYGL